MNSSSDKIVTESYAEHLMKLGDALQNEARELIFASGESQRKGATSLSREQYSLATSMIAKAEELKSQYENLVHV